MNDCLCSHPPHPGRPCKPSCNCQEYRPAPDVGTEAERWLAARSSIHAELESRRADPEFTERIRARVEADREILRRLEEPEDRSGREGGVAS